MRVWAIRGLVVIEAVSLIRWSVRCLVRCSYDIFTVTRIVVSLRKSERVKVYSSPSSCKKCVNMSLSARLNQAVK